MKFLLAFVFLMHTALNSHAQREITISNDGQIIYATIRGNGKPLLLINGGPGYSSARLSTVAEELSKEFQVITFDQRGTGKSLIKQPDSSSINVDAYARDMDAIRSYLKLSSWYVGGHSFGGLLAMAYAARFPKRVDKLLLLSSAGINLNFINSFTDNIKNIVGEDTLKYQLPDTVSYASWYFNMVGINAPAYVFDKSKAEVMRTILVDRTDFKPDIALLMWQDLYRLKFDLRDRLSKFNKPTLILQGGQDIVGMDTAYEIHKTIPKSEVKFIRKCGHVPWLEQPEEFYSSITNFLKRGAK